MTTFIVGEQKLNITADNAISKDIKQQVEPITAYKESVVHILDTVISNLKNVIKESSDSAEKAFQDIDNKVTSVIKDQKGKLERVGEGIVSLTSGAVGPSVTALSKAGVVVSGITALGVGGLSVSAVTLAATLWPFTVGFAGASIILRQISVFIDLGRELREIILTVDVQLQRIYNIYCLMEEISIENNYMINTEMVRKYLVVLLTNILLSSGDETYEKIRESLDKNKLNLTTLAPSDTPSTPIAGHANKIGYDFYKYLFGKKKQLNNSNLDTSAEDFKDALKDKGDRIWRRIYSFTERMLEPKEVMRGITRDLFMLNVYFSILQSEFDLLSRERVELNKQILFEKIVAVEHDTNMETKLNTILSIIKSQNIKSKWIDGASLKRFKDQLPKSNLNILLIENAAGKSIKDIIATVTPQAVSPTQETPVQTFDNPFHHDHQIYSLVNPTVRSEHNPLFHSYVVPLSQEAQEINVRNNSSVRTEESKGTADPSSHNSTTSSSPANSPSSNLPMEKPLMNPLFHRTGGRYTHRKRLKSSTKKHR
jgi:ElaB/YqjD/DUF883 family membrane-anchored ribosome-binding protein